MIIDRDMNVFEADPSSRARLLLVAGDAVTYRIEFPELLDVEMDEFARCGALISRARLLRFQGGQ